MKTFFRTVLFKNTSLGDLHTTVYDDIKMASYSIEDICRILEIENKSIISEWVSEEHRTNDCVTKDGLLKIIFICGKPKATMFTEWLYNDVFPSIEEPVKSYGVPYQSMY